MSRPARTALLALALLAASALPATAQVGLGVNASTLGVGGDVSLMVAPVLGVRGRVSVQPWEPSHTVDDVEVTASMSSPNLSAFVDFYPFGRTLRLVGGVVKFGSNIEVVGVPLNDVEINGVLYEPGQIGRVIGTIVTRETAPYAGIGFGSPVGGFGLVLDLGVAFQGKPTLDVTTDGILSGEPTFQANLDAEIADAERELERFRFYPVVSLGFSIGL
ncbi:MAG: hypothetical protein R3E98_14310 [Gemmatimonadota bacterium]|nr:hypothetical protein [Gemmatimonadota bacterium]